MHSFYDYNTLQRLTGAGRWPPTTTVAIALLLAAALPKNLSAEEELDFNRDVRPILSGKCFHCHGPDAESREANLRLDLEEEAKSDHGYGPVIVAGDPDASRLVNRIEAEEEWELMPPADSGKVLKDEEKAILRRWIAEGASWSAAWAYQKPKQMDVENELVLEGGNWIDPFLRRGMRSRGLEPSEEADRTTLIRRLSFDLTGLPPTPSEVVAFTRDGSPDAYEKLVDRLLDSPRYGERMAMYWLDLVRYADTVGYHGDQNHHASPYRDWVIDAFNDNMAFDDFTTAQLAGDFLPGDNQENLIASGYNRILQTNHEGGVQRKEYNAIYAADRVRNLSAVWMAATMGCCQCHDHKYDPLSTKEFYSLAAFFADVDDTHHLSHIVNREYTLRHPEIVVLDPEEEAQVAALRAKLAELEENSDTVSQSNDGLVPDTETQIKKLEESIKAIEGSARRMMITKRCEPRTMRVLPRGNWQDESGEVVLPQTPEAFGTLDVGDRRATRLDLAHWLCDPNAGVGGLTARVMVNRYWYLLFGEGLARNLEDFGAQGEAPSHPELLDALAVDYIDSGWDSKHILRTIVMSRAYRQSSDNTAERAERDPQNRWLARQSRFRLPAEMIRDNALSVSGLLVIEVGGRSIRPYQPEGHYRHLNFPKRTYKPDTDQQQWRRGVYVHWQRQFLHPMLAAFDAPNREQCTARRPKSNTPLAALTLLNDPTFIESARQLAVRGMSKDLASDAATVEFIFELATSRLPTDVELNRLLECLGEFRNHYQNHASDAEALTAVGLTPLDASLDRPELASWTELCRILLNLAEVNMRS